MDELGTSAMELTRLQSDKKRLKGMHLQFMQFILCAGSDLISITEHSVLPNYNKDNVKSCLLFKFSVTDF